MLRRLTTLLVLNCTIVEVVGCRDNGRRKIKENDEEVETPLGVVNDGY